MKTYDEYFVHTMAENALDAAILSIQEELELKDSNVVSYFFSPDKESQFIDLLKQYIQAEINFKKVAP